MTLTIDSTIGLEDIQRQALIVLLDQLGDALVAVSSKWDAKDAEFATRLDIPFEPTTLEPIEPQNFYEGHAPSLINAPIEKYPNVAAMCFRATPGPDNDALDHASQFTNSLVIDTMVKAEDDRKVNRRIQRTAEAINLCIQSSPTLYGVVDGLSTAPTVDITDVFLRREKQKGHYGPEWCWQGARLSYGVRKMATMASSNGAFMPSAGFTIDQS